MKLSKIEWFVIIGSLAVSGIFVYIFVALPIETIKEITVLTTKDKTISIGLVIVIAGILTIFFTLRSCIKYLREVFYGDGKG